MLPRTSCLVNCWSWFGTFRHLHDLHTKNKAPIIMGPISFCFSFEFFKAMSSITHSGRAFSWTDFGPSLLYNRYFLVNSQETIPSASSVGFGLSCSLNVATTWLMAPQNVLTPKAEQDDLKNHPSRIAKAKAPMILIRCLWLSLSRKISESRPIDLQYRIHRFQDSSWLALFFLEQLVHGQGLK